MSLEIARQIVELIQKNDEVDISDTLDVYSPEQRQRIMSIKHKRSSLIFIAVAHECISVVKYFLESCRADPNSFGWKNGEKLSCIALAIDIRSDTAVDLLLEYGANTEVSSCCGRTPLFHACCDDREDIVRRLIEHGADVNSRNCSGETPLAVSTENLNLLKYLISKGADVNSVDDFGQTALMICCETEEDEVIQFLLSCENIDVKIRNDYGEDALQLAVRYCSGNIVKDIIKRGSYSKKEIIEVYELESCFSRIEEDEEKARELWQKALKLRLKPRNTPMFENPCSVGKLKKFIGVLNFDAVSAMMYLESMHGLNSLFTLGAYTCATCNVNNEDKYINCCEFFFDSLHSLDDRLFLKSLRQSAVLLRHYLYGTFPNNVLNLSKIFGMFVDFVEEIRVRMEHMTIQERVSHTTEIESLLYFIVELVSTIEEKSQGEMFLFHEGIKRILKTDLRGLRQKSLVQICGGLKCPDKIIKCFIRCGANFNSPDKEGKTILHELVESDIPSREKIVKNIIDYGFDFDRVRCDEYCLPCRLERENMIPHSVKYISLQCLAARTLCEKTITCNCDVPRYLKAFVDSHFFLA